MKIIDCKQGSEQWMEARAGIPTASELDNLVTPEWKIRKGAGVDSYLAKKVAERWFGGALPGFSVFETEQGKILEGEAIPWLELERNIEVKRVGFITTDDGKAGCSPDGVIGERGLEIKCPSPAVHVSYLLAGVLPKDYAAQVQGGLYVTGWKEWTFLSYSRRFPALELTITSNDEAQSAIEEALALFTAKLDRAYARLLEINGGPPRRSQQDFARQSTKDAEKYFGMEPSNA